MREIGRATNDYLLYCLSKETLRKRICIQALFYFEEKKTKGKNHIFFRFTKK